MIIYYKDKSRYLSVFGEVELKFGWIQHKFGEASCRTALSGKRISNF